MGEYSNYMTGLDFWSSASYAVSVKGGRKMKRYIIWKVNHSGLCGLEALPEGKSMVTMIEKAQRNLRRFGEPDGMTYRLHEGNLATALRETTRI